MWKRFAALALGLGLMASPAAAQVDLGAGFSITGSATATTDYVFRSISQTRSRPALQGALEVSHDTGFYVGTFISNVAFLGTNARQEVDVIGGWRHSFGPISLDIGGTWYTYPGYENQPGQYGINYAEGILKLSYQFEPITVLGTAAYSPNYFGSSGNSMYVEGGLDWATPLFGITLSGRLGYQWIERNRRFGTPDYLAYAIYVSRDIGAGFSVSAGWWGTDISQSECAGDQKVCDGRFIAALTFKF